ncbi:MAG: aminoacyl--tRNA ligase-related protein [Patescibacteria group bacterium]|jgi:prolyl-tRNA synthetase
MLQSQLFYKTTKEISEEEKSINARILVRAGFVDKLMAGVYSYLPLGLRVLNKIKNIIREEMNAIGGQEILMPALTPKENWTTTGRWDTIDVLFKLEGSGGKEYALGSTHEEIVTPLVKKMINSYKDLPVAVYQIQDKFRDEPRAKSGLLRGREFSMKDLYSFHADEADLDSYYEKAKAAYLKIFHRLGLDAIVAEASGGTFSKYSHEFQVLTESGEDIIFYCEKCRYAQNREVAEIKAGDKCPKCGGKIAEGKAIEVGNIFKLKTKFSEAFNLNFLDKEGKKKLAVMGCYGIGPSRVMGAIVEVSNDERGIIWPKEVAPFDIHLVAIFGKDDKKNKEIKSKAAEVYDALQKERKEVLYDDREDVSAGVKLAESDLFGIPIRLVISEKTLEKDGVEIKKRAEKEVEIIKLNKIEEALGK